MKSIPPTRWHAHAIGPVVVAAAWACYGPLGLKYATMLAMAACLLAGLAKHRVRDLRGTASAAGLSAALLVWLAVTAVWSPADWRDIRAHLWLYAQLLLVPLVAATCPPEVARRGLRHFALASATVALVFVLARAGLLPEWPGVWHTTVDAEGNQRIATSILLALGACVCAWLALGGHTPDRWLWAAGALLCLAGLTLQDRRTGMVLLPAALIAWALVRQPSAWRRAGMALAIAASMLLAWHVSDGVRARFTEGLSELHQYRSTDAVATSWGQRLRMWELTTSMVREHPLVGHGVGSWQLLWRQRITPGTALAEHSTPHNEYLLLAQQGGFIALALWLLVLANRLWAAARAGRAGVPSLLFWTALAWVGLFNAVLRDGKFGLPLILLAALAAAAEQPTSTSPARPKP